MFALGSRSARAGVGIASWECLPESRWIVKNPSVTNQSRGPEFTLPPLLRGVLATVRE